MEIKSILNKFNEVIHNMQELTNLLRQLNDNVFFDKNIHTNNEYNNMKEKGQKEIRELSFQISKFLNNINSTIGKYTDENLKARFREFRKRASALKNMYNNETKFEKFADFKIEWKELLDDTKEERKLCMKNLK